MIKSDDFNSGDTDDSNNTPFWPHPKSSQWFAYLASESDGLPRFLHPYR